MTKNPEIAYSGDSLKITYRWMTLLFIAFLTAVISSCEPGPGSIDGTSQDDPPAGNWTLVSIYHYYYDQNNRLIREVDDNNLDYQIGSGDIVWLYNYSSDGLRSRYLKYNGSSAEPSAFGTYFYDSDGCNDRLEEENAQGTGLQVWIYDVNPDCTRNSYEYVADDATETGSYFYNIEGRVVRLELDSGEYWEYVLNDDGNRLRYDFFSSDGDLYRYGVYDYNSDGRLERLNNYERR